MITHVVASIVKYLSKKGEGIINVMDFLEETDLYKVDLTETLSFLQNSDFTKKLNGFMQSQAKSCGRSLLYLVRELLSALSLNPKDGRLHFENKTLRYIALNPALTLKRMLDEADKIILASGTLEPTAEYDVLKEYLHPTADMIFKFECGHIIPKDNLRCLLVDGFNEAMNFRFDRRKDERQMANLGALMLHLAK